MLLFLPRRRRRRFATRFRAGALYRLVTPRAMQESCDGREEMSMNLTHLGERGRLMEARSGHGPEA
jgi:hypothetical protein